MRSDNSFWYTYIFLDINAPIGLSHYIFALLLSFARTVIFTVSLPNCWLQVNDNDMINNNTLMIMLVGLSMTATWSQRGITTEGDREWGNEKVLSPFIFRIIKGPWANWIIMDPLNTIDWNATDWVLPRARILMKILFLFRLLGRWAVFLWIIIKTQQGTI